MYLLSFVHCISNTYILFNIFRKNKTMNCIQTVICDKKLQVSSIQSYIRVVNIILNTIFTIFFFISVLIITN